MFDPGSILRTFMDLLLRALGYFLVGVMFVLTLALLYLGIMMAYGLAMEIYRTYKRSKKKAEDRILLIRRKQPVRIQRGYNRRRREIRMAMQRRRLVFPQADGTTYVGDGFYISRHMKPFWPVVPAEEWKQVVFANMRQGRKW